MSLGGVTGPALATEFDVINTSTPSLNYLIDDANVLNKTTKKAVNDRLYKLEVTGRQDPCCFELCNDHTSEEASLHCRQRQVTEWRL